MSEIEWRAALRRLVAASSEDEAARAAADLIDTAVPGGAVVADDGPAIVRAIASVIDVAGLAWRAYVLAVLRTISMWSRTWRTLVADGAGQAGIVVRAVAEADLESELVGAARVLQPLLRDSDAQVRAMMYGLVGALDIPDNDVVLIGAADGGRDDRARGSAVAAVLPALSRTPAGSKPTSEAWLRAAVEEGSFAVRGRVRRELESVHRRPEQRSRAIDLARESVEALPGDVPAWPAESV